MLRRVLRWVPLAIVALSATTAAAQDPSEEDIERARHHFNSGVAYFEDGRFDDAAREFAEAYRLTGHQDVLYNLGQAHDRRGAYEDALAAYRSYLDSGQDEAGRVHRRVQELEVLLATGEPVDHPPPSHSRPEHPSEGGLDLGPVPYIVLGVGAATGIAAVVTGLLAAGKKSDLDALCGDDRRCPPEARDIIDDGEGLQTVTNVLWVTAGVIVAAGATLLVLDLATGSSTDAQVGLGPGSVTATVRF